MKKLLLMLSIFISTTVTLPSAYQNSDIATHSSLPVPDHMGLSTEVTDHIKLHIIHVMPSYLSKQLTAHQLSDTYAEALNIQRATSQETMHRAKLTWTDGKGIQCSFTASFDDSLLANK